MNVCLTNRKHLSKLMGTFVDSAVLDPKLIDSINHNDINEGYVENIKILCQKLEYLKKSVQL
jgi:vacuolar protein sorting-associated protein 52